MIKWKLLLQTLPVVIGVLLIAFLRDRVMMLKGVVEFSDISALLSAVALIIGFMLAGVLADYKESEKIPGEIAAALETIGDTVKVVVRLNRDTDVSQFEPRFFALAKAVHDWFLRREKVESCYLALDEFHQVVTDMHPAAGVNYTVRALGEIHNLRRLVTRADVISRTSFIPAGYALLDLLVGSTLVLLLISNYKNNFAEYLLIGILSLIYFYLIRLIRDLDEPFEYHQGKRLGGAAEVDPYPLVEYIQRLENAK